MKVRQMRHNKHILKSLVLGINGGDAVTVRETNFGYIIHSAKGGKDASLRRVILRLSLVAVWICVAGLWLLPASTLGVIGKLFLSVVLLATAYVVRLLGQGDAGGFELHVDTSRRELRSAVLTSKGESWIRNNVRFGEVTAPIMQKGKPDVVLRSLCLRIAGQAELMPVAVGDEATLLAIHDRLMRDLRPLEERLASFHVKAAEVKEARRKVFPTLGPDEVAA